MNDGLIPGRYAKALLKYVREKGVDTKIYGLMTTLAQSFAQEPNLGETIANPFIEADKKTTLLKTAAGADDKDTVFADFLKLLEQNNRLPMARAIADAYRRQYRKDNNIYKVDVTAAAPMGSDEEERLKQMIAKHLGGATMEYSFHVNPDLIGGFTVDVGNERLDASIRNELKQLQHRLLG